MKKLIVISILFTFIVFVLFFIASCGQSGSGPTPGPAPTPTGSVSITGSLYSGTVRTSAIQVAGSGRMSMASAVSPVPDYQVVAVGTKDKLVYFPDADTSSSGNFTISHLPSGESFYLELIDDHKRFVAPVAFGATTTEVIMAVTSEAGNPSIDLGRIVYESGKGVGVPTMEPSFSMLDGHSEAKKKSGETFVPVGAGILGRGTGEAHYIGTLHDAVDEDEDGLPDVVDIDDNGDGKVDGLDPTPRRSGAKEVNIAEINNTNSFANLPRQYEQYPTYINGSVNTTPIDVPNITILAIEIVMAPGHSASEFSDVRVSEGPDWLASATIVGTAIGGYPPDGTPWTNENYRLYSNNDRWVVWVIPHGTPEAGDALKFRVTYANSSVKYILSTITFVFTDIPRLIAYVDAGGTHSGSELNLANYTANSNKFDYSGSNITFKWTAPKDDLGNQISWLEHYLDGILYYTASDTTFSGGSIHITPTAETDSTFGTVYSYTFTPTTDAFSWFKVDVKSQSPASGGSNASQLINFKKI
ncbi:MAG: hypothetical protein NT099_03245 [Candidatus Saganbacteria bacterium]|nr:hypothetical protein [Candidatus Saganbacteria bacterium]